MLPLLRTYANLALTAFCFSRAIPAGASTITDIGVVSGKASSNANGVSNDGQVVVGVSTTSQGTSGVACKWTPAGGMVSLGVLSGFSTSNARAVSKDGTTIVGDLFPGQGNSQGFKHTGGVMTGLGMYQSFATSADGSKVVGYGISEAPEYSFGVSNDGSVVVGRSSGFRAQRWSAGTGPVDLDGVSSVANGVSGNGQVAVGNRNNVACYWSVAGGFASIGTVGVISTAYAANYDGSVIVGQANIGFNGGTQAFVWTAAEGMRSLGSLLTAQGVDLSGWFYQGRASLVVARAISDNGQFIAGSGTTRGFLVNLTPLSLLEQWRLAHFTTSSNTGSAADAEDPDGDGVPNLVEYALGTNPTQPSAGVPAATVVTGHLVVSFHRIADPALTYTVQATATPGLPASWLAIWSSTGAANTDGSVSVSDPVQMSSQPLRFLRLRVTR